MTSLKVNARKETAVEKLSQKARDILQDWLWADQMLYDHFKDKLEKRKYIYGLHTLKNRMEQLVEFNEVVQSDCVDEIITENTILLKEEWGKNIVAFKINDKKSYCKYYGLSESKFISYLREMQLSKFTKWKVTFNV